MLFKSPLCILDTETTGFDFKSYAETIELAAVILNPDGTEAATFQSLVKPTVLDERAAPALAVNKIDPKDLATAPDATTVACLFVKWLFDHDTRFLTAYNVKFDKAALEQLGIEFDDTVSSPSAPDDTVSNPSASKPTAPDDTTPDPSASESLTSAPALQGLNPLKWASCIMETAKVQMKLARSPKLAAAALHYGVTVTGEAHRALTDARTAAGVAIAIQRVRKGIST